MDCGGTTPLFVGVTVNPQQSGVVSPQSKMPSCPKRDFPYVPPKKRIFQDNGNGGKDRWSIQEYLAEEGQGTPPPMVKFRADAKEREAIAMGFRKWIAAAGMASMISGLSACQQIKEHETAQGALIGAGVGAAGGAIIGEATSGKAAKGALIGGLTGAAVGTGVGYAVEKNRN